MSPWVPCPDVVIKRVLEIAAVKSTDVHADLGCGDGRLNFAAVSNPDSPVRRSWGVDVDESILARCRERMERRFVPTFGGGSLEKVDCEDESEADKLEFVQADLTKVIERQKTLHQAKSADGRQPSSIEDALWAKEEGITNRLSETTVITMYFVDDALKQIKPYLESVLGGRPNVRVITIGYEMKGWHATWVERVLGLTVFKYEMADVPDTPLEWNKDGKSGDDEQQEQGEALLIDDAENEYDDVDEDSELGRFLKLKREEDMEELRKGLRIHHDEKLEDFAQSRAKRSSKSPNDESEDEDEDDWDFDETIDPEEIMKEERRRLATEKKNQRRGLVAGLDSGSARGKVGEDPKTPVWKRPS